MTGTATQTGSANRLRGCGTALVTPFTASGAVDEAAMKSLVDWQLEQGMQILVPCGTTGEAVTLEPAEYRRVVEITVEQANGRVPVIAGAGSNDTARAIRLSKEMKSIGVSHLLQVTPMYNKPPQRALLAHFRAIADACDLPIVLYNVPGRTSVNMEAATCLQLASDPRFVAVKEASGNLAQIGTIIRERPENFSVLSGDDGMTLPVMALGGDGVVSVASNIVPREVVALCDALLRNDMESARALHHRLAALVDMIFVESNPIPAKAMLSMMGRMTNTLRLPLLPLADAHITRVHALLVSMGLIQA